MTEQELVRQLDEAKHCANHAKRHDECADVFWDQVFEIERQLDARRVLVDGKKGFVTRWMSTRAGFLPVVSLENGTEVVATTKLVKQSDQISKFDKQTP